MFLVDNNILPGKLIQYQCLMDNIYQLYRRSLEMNQQGIIFFLCRVLETSVLNYRNNQRCMYHKLISFLY